MDMVYPRGSSGNSDCPTLAVGAPYPAAVGAAVERQNMAYADVCGAGGGAIAARAGSRGRKARGAVEEIRVGMAADGGLRRTDGSAASHMHPHADRRLDRPCGRYRRREYRTGFGGDIPLDEKAFFRL